mmetsp:Transcript_35753/g.66150  ORF Transcript_35753/g.66150 Transcript_35753/m.66150 type:complete len:99 (-) Transcript_35753:247-543(-)
MCVCVCACIVRMCTCVRVARWFRYKKFKDFMADIPEIEFINENKVKLKGQSRKRTLAPDSTTETQGSAGKKPKEEAAAATDPAKVVDATAPKEEKKAE